MTTKNCVNGPKLVLKDLCEKSFVRNDRLPFVVQGTYMCVGCGRFSVLHVRQIFFNTTF